MKHLEKAKVIKTVFVGGAKKQLEQEYTWGLAGVIGLSQGLKYKGSIKSGLFGGLATIGTLATVCGLYNISSNWNKIKEVFKEQ